MSCCNNDCCQGRDCPARVARVRYRMPGAEPLPPTRWRDYLVDLARAMLFTVSAMLLGGGVMMLLLWGLR
jgi:hypothetical protein